MSLSWKLLPAVLLACAAAGADPRVKVEPAFEGKMRAGKWTAVRLEVANEKEAARVEVRFETGAEVVVWDRDVPKGGRQAFWVPLEAEERCRWTGVAGEAALGSGEFRTESRSGERLVLAVEDWSLGLRSRGLVKVVSSPASGFPEVREGYASFDAVLVRMEGASLSPGVVEALRRWVRDGGTLIVSAAAAAARAARELGNLLPVEIAGTTETADLSAPGIDGSRLAAPVPVADAIPREGAESDLWGGAWRYGDGRCVFLGFDPYVRPISDSPQLADEWLSRIPEGRRLVFDGLEPREAARLQRERARAAVQREREDDRALAKSFAEAGALTLKVREAPLSWTFLPLLGYVVAVVRVDAFLRRRWGRAWPVRLVLPRAVAGFCAAEWSMSRTDRARAPHVFVIGAVDVGRRVAREASVVTLLAPGHGLCDLDFAAPEVRLSPVPVEEQPGRRGTSIAPLRQLPLISRGRRTSARAIPVAAWAPVSFTAEAELPPGLFSAKRRDGRILVNAPGVLRGCTLRDGAKVTGLGDIEPGMAVEEAAAGSWKPLLEPEWDGPLLTGWLDRSSLAPSLRGPHAVSACIPVRIRLEGPP